MSILDELKELKNKNKNMQETMVRVKPETHALLKELSEAQGVSMRQLVHVAVKHLAESIKSEKRAIEIEKNANSLGSYCDNPGRGY